MVNSGKKLKSKCSTSRSSWRISIVASAFLVVSTGLTAEEFNVETTAVALFESFSKISQQQEPILVEPGRAIEVQDYLIALMRPTWGMDVGYFAEGVDESGAPSTGILLENHFTGTRAVINRAYGINMHAAGELMFRVGSEFINDATAKDEVIASLESVIPAIRMTDRLLPDQAQEDSEQHLAANLQVRMFVLGGEIPLEDSSDVIDRLSDVQIKLLDQSKSIIVASDAAKQHGHPIDAVCNVVEALKQRGIYLRQGDVIGIGSWTDSYPVADLTRLSAKFDGLDAGDPNKILVGFR